jgi:hypothetical protein
MQTPTPETTSIPVTEPETKLGFTRFAELWNGRLAMLGFVAAVIGELVTGQGLLSQMGLM